MTLVRFNPMRELLEVEKEFNKLFGDFDKRFGFGYNKEVDQDMDLATWAPLTDIYEDGDSFRLKLDLPGVSKDDVKISYTNGQIAITGERKQESESDNFKYHRVERNYGKFYRSFDLPKEVDDTKINAEFKNGQLIVEIPKTEKAKPRLIEVKVK